RPRRRAGGGPVLHPDGGALGREAGGHGRARVGPQARAGGHHRRGGQRHRRCALRGDPGQRPRQERDAGARAPRGRAGAGARAVGGPRRLRRGQGAVRRRALGRRRDREQRLGPGAWPRRRTVFQGIEIWQMALGLVGTLVVFILLFFSAMARFLKRPSPSEAIIRIGRATTDVFIARACWIVPVLHRATTMSLSTIGLTIRRTGHDALVSKDFISTNLSAEFYIRVEPNEDDVKKAARTIGIDEGHASSESIRNKAQQLLEPKLVGALRAVAAQNEFLALHLNREHFAQEVSNALREDLGRNGFTLESVTIT